MDYLQQFRALLLKTQKLALPISKCENCDYNVFLYASKNCYMCRGASHLEDCFYCDVSLNGKTSADSSFCKNFELCYSCVDSVNLYNCNFCYDCRDCRDCDFCLECASCSNCFGCSGLRHKEFYIFNKPYSKEAYSANIEKLKTLPHEEIEKKFHQEMLLIPRIAVRGSNNENSTGDHLNNCKNCQWCFGAAECEECIYIYEEMLRCRDCADLTHTHNAELCYDCLTVDNAYNCNCSFWLENCRDCEFGYCLHRCSDCFMSTYLQGKKFYILNEPYSESDYRKKVLEIRGWLLEKKLYGQNLIYLALKDTTEITQFFA